MSREHYQVPTGGSNFGNGITSQGSHQTGGNNATTGDGNNTNNNPTTGNVDNPTDANGNPIAKANEIYYVCSICTHLTPLRRGDQVRCKDCGHRILYKERTKRVVQFEAR